MKILLSTVLAGVSLAALTGCSSSDAQAGSSPTALPTQIASGGSVPKAHETCGVRPGKNGVMEAFCGGTAKVTASLDGVRHVITGGTCRSGLGAQLVVDAGVEMLPTYQGRRPDFFGAVFVKNSGRVAQALSITLEGKQYSLLSAQGTLDNGRSGHLSGATLQHQQVDIDFTC